MSINKKLIKSSTTVYNRCKPRNSRSIQAKKHRGKGLFCTKQPPKAEDVNNENTHYQRAHVKNVKKSFFSKNVESSRHLRFMRSIDDKAYLRPGTSEGFLNTRCQKILTVSDFSKARQLPKYDWPQKLMYQTPGSHRIFTKTSVMSGDDEEKLIMKDDNHFVFIGPKAIINSSGSTWASETIRLRQRHPDLFEIKDKIPGYSSQSGTRFLFEDMSEREDLCKATGARTCIYTT